MAAPTRVGITGHQEVPANAKRYVAEHIEKQLRLYGSVVGLTALAGGADQLFADLVVLNGGQLIAIIPSDQYERSFASAKHRASYRRLKARASEVRELHFPQPAEDAYWAAGKCIVDGCDVLIAIWDGRPSRGLGGTADIVDYARSRGRETVVIWPDGVGRP